MYGASLQLRRQIECYLSYSYDFSIHKLLPFCYANNQGHTADSLIAVHTTHQFFEQLPYLSEGTLDQEPVGSTREEKQRLIFLSSVLLRRLNEHASRCCGESTTGSDSMGKRSTFIAWMVLTIYAHFAQEAEIRSSIWHRGRGLKDVVATSSSKARFRVLANWVEGRRFQKQQQEAYDGHFTRTQVLVQEGFLNPSAKLAAVGEAFSREEIVTVKDENQKEEEEALWREMQAVFHGEKGELTDPIAADKHLFYHFFLQHIDPLLQSYPTLDSSRCASPFPSPETEDPSAWGARCLAYAKSQFAPQPFSPDISVLYAVVAATTQTLPYLKQARACLQDWERRWADSVLGRPRDNTTESGDGNSSTKPLERLSERGKSEFVTQYKSLLYQSLFLAQAAVQLIPSSIHTEAVEAVALSEDSHAPSHLCGSWLTGTPAFSSRVCHYRLLHRSRGCVVFPGLAIAAVEMRSAVPRDTGQRTSGLSAGSGAATASSVTTAPFPDAVIGTGTLLVSPPSARQALGLARSKESFRDRSEEQQSAAAQADGASVQVFRPVALHPCAWVLLLHRFPVLTTEPLCDESDSEDPSLSPLSKPTGGVPLLRYEHLVQAVARIREGIVLILVETDVGKQEQRAIEGWGTQTRTVVMVGSIGQWGMSQLALRWNIVPNTLFTQPSQLRCLQADKAGVLLYALDEMDFIVCGDAHLKGDGKGTVAPGLVERRTRWLVVVGECERAYRKVPSREALGAPVRLMSMTGALVDDDDDSVFSSTVSECSDLSSLNSMRGWGTGGGTREDGPFLPFSGHVRCSLLIADATDALQRKALLTARVLRQHLIHRAVLPERMGAFLLTGNGALERTVRDHVRELRRSIFTLPRKPVGEGGHDDVLPDATVLFHTRILHAMEDGLQSYLLHSAQHDHGFSIEQAWEYVNGAYESQPVQHASSNEASSWNAFARTGSGTSEAAERLQGAVAGEIRLAVRSAYFAIADCLDELCHTVLLSSRSTPKLSPREGAGSEELYFLPMIE